MRLSQIISHLVFLLVLLQACRSPEQEQKLTLGDERFDEYIPLIEGKRVAVFSNHTGIVGDKVTESGYGPHLVDVLIGKGIDVEAIFSPEHGFRGTADAGERVSGEVDDKTGVEIISLYGGSDAYRKGNMDKFDVLLVDIQDVGLRYYTYYVSMLHLMEACARNGKKVIVLDRPNPNGFYVDGPILDMRYKSGVGALPITTVHGMTLGELARMINGEGWLQDGLQCDLTVIPCLGYDHSMKTQVVIPPSPNLKTMRAIYLYASTCYFEGTPVSLGRGTDNPFEMFGHPDMKADYSFTPKSVPGAKNPPLKDKLCYGYDLREKPLEEIWDEGINLEYVITAFQSLQIGESFFTSFFDKLAGVEYIREMILSGASADEIKARWKDDVESFRARRRPYLLYFDPAEPCVTFSEEAGSFRGKSKTISLSAPEGWSIHYTTDGSVPTPESPLYQGPITLSKTGNHWVDQNTIDLMTLKYQGNPITSVRVSSKLPSANIIRAIAVAPDGSVGDVATKTYFIGADLKKDYKDVMVISIVTDPDNILGYETGILAKGKLYDDWISTPGAESILAKKKWWEVKANYTSKGKVWERPASIELFDASNTLTLQEECGIRIKGRASRLFAQKSWNISFKMPYGDGCMNYPLFPDAVDTTGKVITKYKSFSLRNGGNDTDLLKFKDAWIQSRVSDREFSTQKSRIAVLFLNGEYWGHYNLIEKYNSDYIENHYGVGDPLIISEDKLEDGKGSDFHLYEELISFRDKDLSIASNWEEFKKVMDIQSMADYFATEIYIANSDWRDTTNVKLWRSASINPSNPYADGRWRYLLCDCEFSSSAYSTEKTQAKFNSLDCSMREHTLFASAMRNPEFQDLCKTTINEIARKNFDPIDVKTDLKAWAKRWKPYMRYYYKRFGKINWAWILNIKSTKEFFEERYDYVQDW